MRSSRHVPALQRGQRGRSRDTRSNKEAQGHSNAPGIAPERQRFAKICLTEPRARPTGGPCGRRPLETPLPSDLRPHRAGELLQRLEAGIGDVGSAEGAADGPLGGVSGPPRVKHDAARRASGLGRKIEILCGMTWRVSLERCTQHTQTST